MKLAKTLALRSERVQLTFFFFLNGSTANSNLDFQLLRWHIRISHVNRRAALDGKQFFFTRVPRWIPTAPSHRHGHENVDSGLSGESYSYLCLLRGSLLCEVQFSSVMSKVVDRSFAVERGLSVMVVCV
jgi:hypothetical protein